MSGEGGSPAGPTEGSGSGQFSAKELNEAVNRSRAELQKRMEDIRRRTQGRTLFEPLKSTAEARDQLEIDDLQEIVRLKKILARGAFIAVGAQLLIADSAFIIYAFANSWKLPPEVMIGWLSSTVVQTVGIVFIIARHLFPNRTTE